MATVYLASDLKHDRPVAIKVLKPELATVLGPERFLREIRLTAQLNHPNILPLLDSGEAGGLLYYVMPFVEGESLRDRLTRTGPLPIADALRYLRDVADALAEAHAHSIVHRDIKPANVLIHGRHALVADFGVAKAVGDAAAPDQLTTAGVAVGTPAYMAPEQATGDPHIDHRVDIYAFGALGYEMLTGSAPFERTSAQEVLAAQVLDQPDPVTRHRADAPPRLANLLAKCMAKRAVDRWASADEVLTQLEEQITPSGGTSLAVIRAAISQRLQGVRRRLTPLRVVTALAALLVIVVAAAAAKRWGRVRWARAQLPTIQRLVDEGERAKAYALAVQADAIIPRDAVLAALWPRLTRWAAIVSEPPGARVSIRDYGAGDGAWRPIGTTPIDSVRFPALFPSTSQIKLEKAGFSTVYDVAGSSPGSGLVTVRYRLDSIGALPADMVRIPRGRVVLLLNGLDDLPPLVLNSYLIGRFEVTNKQYKQFVDSGGYQRREYWDQPFVKNGKTLAWEDAMKAFTDKTGRPGPATWEAGDYPTGQDEYPVAGVSWYEAEAFAKFAGMALPTVYHWSGASAMFLSASILPLSNIGRRGTGLARVGVYRGMGRSGVYDMAGNVREWSANQGRGDERYILGGGWNDPSYGFNDAVTQPPFDRSAINGFRLVKYLGPDSNLAQAQRAVNRSYRDFSKERPAPDNVFNIYRRMYAYDRTPLNAAIEDRDSSSTDWLKERITFDAAYGQDRVIAYLYLPTHRRPPYQAVIYFPGSNVIGAQSSKDVTPAYFDFVLKSGRAVLLPVLKGTFERSDGLKSDYPNETNFYKEHVIDWAKDLGRSIDYLATRGDIDSQKLAYYGLSWGAAMGGIMLAVEPRFKVGVLYVAGLYSQRAQPEVEPINFLPRIRVPVLQLNGRYDFYFPVTTSQTPFFNLLGSPPGQKRRVLAEGGHDVPRPVLIKETLDWLDTYLGPVR